MFKVLVEAFKVKKRPSILGFLEIFLCIVIGNSLGVFLSTFHLMTSTWIWIGRVLFTILFIVVSGKIFLLAENKDQIEKKYKLIFGFMFVVWSLFIKLSP